MKILSLLLFVAIVGVWADDFSELMPDPSWAKPFVSFKSNLTVKDDPSCPGPYSCTDCNTARVCKPTADNGVFVVVQEIQCPKERPFCSPESGTCVTDAPGSCGGPDNFICMGNGRYPDSNCQKFHVCVNYVPTSFECKIEGHTYNPKTQVCEQSTACGTFDCTTNQVRKVAHDFHPKFFAYCNQDSKGLLVVDSCPPQFKLDTDTQLCTPDCVKEGIIPDPEDCHHYYKCSNIHLKRDLNYWKVDKLKCPDGQAYSATDFLCVDETKVDSCQKKQ